ncbi:MAG: hypothetical protein Q9209_003921 [Squamulea sp. 1 TL-2023]
MRTLLPPPPSSSPDYSPTLATLAARILYPNPLPSTATHIPLYILNSAAFPDVRSTSYDDLIPYVLARLPSEDDLLAGQQYEIIFFAKASADQDAGKSGKDAKKKRPGWQWCVQTYQLLSRVLRKRLSRLWIVGAESWVRMLVEGVMVINGGKGRKKVVFTEGIFRVNAKAVMVEVLQELYERGQQFIVWQERDTVLCFPCWRDGTGDVGMDELKEKDGFDVLAAAGLIKLWYKELREPIFPQSCYQALEKFYGDADLQLEPQQLIEILRPDAEWTILSATARRILRMHLLPLLARVTQFEEWNHMTAYGLAVCFAPALLKGPDIEEDLKMMGIVRRLLEAMIRDWKDHLAPALGTDYESFEAELRLPEVIADREDPLEEGDDGSYTSLEAQQMTGITLVDNDGSASDTQHEDDEEEEDDDEPPPLPQRHPPPLPPRPRTFLGSPDERPSLPPRVRSSTIADIPITSPTSSLINGTDNSVKRKPAPTVQPLPRYSMIVGPSSAQAPATLEHIPFYNSVEQPSEEPEGLDGYVDGDGELPEYEAVREASQGMVIPRKPVPKCPKEEG